jgi:hypothetical protein
MEFLRRKVYLSKYFRPYDSDGDGILDSLILSATTKTLQIPLIQKFDDIGIYRTLDPMVEDVEIIDIDNLWSTSNDGRGDVDYTEVDTQSSATNQGDEGSVNQEGTNSIGSVCTDDTAINYILNEEGYTNATLGTNINGDSVLILSSGEELLYTSCSDCCNYPTTSEGGINESPACVPEPVSITETNRKDVGCSLVTTSKTYQAKGSNITSYTHSDGTSYTLKDIRYIGNLSSNVEITEEPKTDADKISLCNSNCGTNLRFDEWIPTVENGINNECTFQINNCNSYPDGLITNNSTWWDENDISNQGDCNNTKPFVGVKLKTVETPTTCCKFKKTAYYVKDKTVQLSGADKIKVVSYEYCAETETRYKYRYCYWCY